ncbi:hypothetical protein C8Q74DRAFT_1372642 [Fomes fomentarius]|nr:hypothetical protein C8Q74DRAFT_1372642 [Fomes fomentarius]
MNSTLAIPNSSAPHTNPGLSLQRYKKLSRNLHAQVSRADGSAARRPATSRMAHRATGLTGRSAEQGADELESPERADPEHAGYAATGRYLTAHAEDHYRVVTAAIIVVLVFLILVILYFNSRRQSDERLGGISTLRVDLYSARTVTVRCPS